MRRSGSLQYSYQLKHESYYYAIFFASTGTEDVFCDLYLKVFPFIFFFILFLCFYYF